MGTPIQQWWLPMAILDNQQSRLLVPAQFELGAAEIVASLAASRGPRHLNPLSTRR
jgi:hypothetical protein